MSFINHCVIAKLTRLIAQSWSTIKQLETEKKIVFFYKFFGSKIRYVWQYMYSYKSFNLNKMFLT